MSTHGRILVKGGHAEDGDIHVYAWHDGHTTDALDMLLRLPWRTFNEGKESAISERKPGFWFYETMLREVTRAVPTYKSRNELLSAWDALIPLQTSAISIANWIVWQRFNHWHVVPNLEWCAYPGDEPDVVVQVDENTRLVGYTVWLPGVDSEYAGEYWEQIENTLAELNKTVSADAALRIMDRATSLSEDKRAVNLPKIYVPIDLIIVDLMWQDVENGEYPKKRRRDSG